MFSGVVVDGRGWGWRDVLGVACASGTARKSTAGRGHFVGGGIVWFYSVTDNAALAAVGSTARTTMPT